MQSTDRPNKLGDCQYRHDWIDGKCNTCGAVMEPAKTTAVDDARPQDESSVAFLHDENRSLRSKVAELEDQLCQEREEVAELEKHIARQHTVNASLQAKLRTANESERQLADSIVGFQAQVSQLQATISQLTGERLALRTRLYLVQWVPTNAPFCPSCFNTSSEGHKNDCTLAAALYPSSYPASMAKISKEEAE